MLNAKFTFKSVFRQLSAMGKKRSAFRNRNKDNNRRPPPANHVPYDDLIRENDKFVSYYKQQNVCPAEEFEQFLTSLKSDLPSTFRITGSKSQAKKLLEIVKGQMIEECLSKGVGDGEAPKIFPLPWYPDSLAWQMELSRKDIRREETFYKLHNFLISETENGTISRQEAVSMIPPLVLDVQPHHKVLDMCAAPGSKTAQLLEMLHATNDECSIPSGYVIANDVDNKRCYMLVHQAKRLNSPCMAIINHDSSVLPNMLTALPDGSKQQVRFDRILCDVPCSGDGTLRKNPDIWMKWTPANGINLHGIQFRILRRGMELLEEGGRLVYSTCSINPIENESVIHRLLAQYEGAVELVDVSKELPGLKYAKGLEHWQVGSRNLEFYNTFEEVDEKWRTTIRPQMFPPKPEDYAKYNLNRCVRVLPHHQNTGAFFVAVLKKIAPINPRKEFIKNLSKGQENAETSSNNDNDNENGENENAAATGERKRVNEDSQPQNQRKKRRQEGFREDPFVFFKEDEQVWPDIKKYYFINDEFDVKNLLVRCHTGKKKNIYLTSSAIRDLVTENQGNVKFINTGVKCFVRTDNRNMKCAFRIANDGLESIFPFIGEGRKVHIGKEDLIRLLLNDNPEKSPPIDELNEEVQAQVKPLSPGSCILIYTENSEGSEPFILHLSGWRGTSSLRCYMSQHSTVHLLRILGADVTKYEKNKFIKKEEESEETLTKKEEGEENEEGQDNVVEGSSL